MFKRLIIITAIAITYSRNVHAFMGDFYWPCLYIGADAQYRYIPFENKFGGNIYKKHYPQANGYIGLMGNEYMGMEVGYEFSRTKTHTTTVRSDDFLLGIRSLFDVRQNVIVRFKGLHASLVGYIPVCNYDNFKILASVGILSLKVKLENSATHVDNIEGTPITIRLTESKYVLRLMTGVQYMLTDYFGIRANLRWENTAKLKNIVPIRSLSSSTAKTKDSVVLGLGIVVQF